LLFELTIPRLEKPETYCVFMADYELYLLYLQTTAWDNAIEPCTVTKTPTYIKCLGGFCSLPVAIGSWE
jgi:hypothetical protein